MDLTGKWLSDSREVRIVTNLCVYWDEVFLSEDATDSDIHLQAPPTESADLRFRGFSPAVIHPERKQPERFSYCESDADIDVEPDAGTLHAIRRCPCS